MAEKSGSGKGWHGEPERHAAAGRKGGASVSADRVHMARIGRMGGTKRAEDRESMVAIGRLGGLATRKLRRGE